MVPCPGTEDGLYPPGQGIDNQAFFDALHCGRQKASMGYVRSLREWTPLCLAQ
jgi:hypothetical protein